MEVTIRPISIYPVPETKHRRRSPFKAAESRSIQILKYELQRIGAKDVVIEIDITEYDCRADGWMRVNARARTPRVVVSFTHPTAGGVRYPCDTFQAWIDNIHAIALALEALRAVDRYGVTRKGEQYAGWKALPATTSNGMNVDAAAGLLSSYSGVDARVIALASKHARQAYREAIKKTHPDAGGSAEAFDLVQKARSVLVAHFGAEL